MAVQHVEAIECAGIKTHVPVAVQMYPRAAAMKALYVRPPPRIPRENVFGPIPVPMNWGEALEMAERAVEAARRGTRDEAEDKLERAYKTWADTAEQELCDVTGTCLPKAGLRGLRPNIVWRSILPEKAPREGYPRAAVAMNLHGVAQELGRIAGCGANDLTRDRRGADGEATLQAMADHEGTVEDEDELAEQDDDDMTHDGHGVIDDIISSLDAVTDQPMHDEVLTDLTNRVRLAAAELRACPAGNGLTQGGRGEDLREQIRSLRDEAGKMQEKIRREEEAEAKKSWEAWLTDGFDKGAKNAHLFSKEPEGWTPTATRATVDYPIISSDPVALQEEQRRKYAARWGAADTPHRYEWEDRTALPRLTPEVIRQASLSHKITTAETFEGMHPRHFSLLSDGGLEVVAALMEAAELLGCVPRQLQLATMPLIGKPKGGYRGIGVLPGFYRVWGRARRREADAWERQHKRAYFSASEGNGAVDTVWRQAARQEAGVAEGKEAAGLIYDLEAFYELIDRGLLVCRARDADFPLPVLRLALGMYAAPRVLSMRGRASRELHPVRGIIAGCPLATTLVKVFCL